MTTIPTIPGVRLDPRKNWRPIELPPGEYTLPFAPRWGRVKPLVTDGVIVWCLIQHTAEPEWTDGTFLVPPPVYVDVHLTNLRKHEWTITLTESSAKLEKARPRPTKADQLFAQLEADLFG